MSQANGQELLRDHNLQEIPSSWQRLAAAISKDGYEGGQKLRLRMIDQIRKDVQDVVELLESKRELIPTNGVLDTLRESAEETVPSIVLGLSEYSITTQYLTLWARKGTEALHSQEAGG